MAGQGELLVSWWVMAEANAGLLGLASIQVLKSECPAPQAWPGVKVGRRWCYKLVVWHFQGSCSMQEA